MNYIKEPKPLHTHDCDKCIFLGSDNENDYYYCHDEKHPVLSSLIARYGEEEKYTSGLSFAMSSIPINNALKLAVEQNVLNQETKDYIKDKQNEWFDYCEKDKTYARNIASEWGDKKRFVIE